MTGIEYVRQVCKEKGISIRKLEKDLGFSNGYINPKKIQKLPYERAVLIAQYLEADLSLILGEDDIPTQNPYYINDETAQIAQEIFENKNLRALFSAARNADADDLKMAHDMLLALKRKERGE